MVCAASLHTPKGQLSGATTAPPMAAIAVAAVHTCGRSSPRSGSPRAGSPRSSSRSSIDLLPMERPRFPEGLRVLLLESAASSSNTTALLQGLKYEVMAVGELSGALAALRRNSSSGSGSCCSRAFDVVLADSQLLAGDGQLLLLRGAQPLPVVLMGGERCSAAEVLAAVEAGAADVLDRPLSQLKLRNLWQHTVRMMMCADSSNSGGSCQGSPRATPPAAAAAAAAALQHQLA